MEDLCYSALVRFLRLHGYEEVSTEPRESGYFWVQGDTVQWWPVTEVNPWRMHFFGEELEFAEERDETTWRRTEWRGTVQANTIDTEHGVLKVGDYLVHPHHGVGIFRGWTTQLSLGEVRQFVRLEYAADDLLLFPGAKVHELMPYIGSRQPRLTRLHSQAWANTVERVQKNLIGIARALLKLFLTRQRSSRPRYERPEQWIREVQERAGFTLTSDQERALAAIHRDLAESDHPMDRLLCGDVGFGKTEVALQAALYALASGRQVALIAPTTVLAAQHAETFRNRLGHLPLRIEEVSRIRGDNDVVKAISTGQVDLVIGTHRVLGEGIQFHNLGLLIIDEEQKFGVSHKERLAELRPHLDVLTLTATPIPRTLSLSLSGLKGLSILREPPQGRKPVATQVLSYRPEAVRDAILEEHSRTGQVYVVHNRVQSIGVVRLRVEDDLKAAGKEIQQYEDGKPRREGVLVTALGHGQMDGNKLAKILHAFLHGDIDVLFATSIVENGLDAPSANTLIVLHAERFGLADLYQLRGRVGRRERQAHALFCIGGLERAQDEAAEQQLSVDARRRLEALVEADQLGSGWTIALRDLEIRGGGNVLGHEQHGSLEAIGLLLYGQLLQEEIGRQAKRAGVAIFSAPDTTREGD
jgi:transcription-repair coupling factor (superfamily II helicase)